MFEEYQKLCDIPDSDWEQLPLCTVVAGEFEGDHTMTAMRMLKANGDNCTQVYAKIIQFYPNISPDDLFDLVSDNIERVKWEVRYKNVEIIDKDEEGLMTLYGEMF
jgi:hypothetical protein